MKHEHAEEVKPRESELGWPAQELVEDLKLCPAEANSVVLGRLLQSFGNLLHKVGLGDIQGEVGAGGELGVELEDLGDDSGELGVLEGHVGLFRVVAGRGCVHGWTKAGGGRTSGERVNAPAVRGSGRRRPRIPVSGEGVLGDSAASKGGTLGILDDEFGNLVEEGLREFLAVDKILGGGVRILVYVVGELPGGQTVLQVHIKDIVVLLAVVSCLPRVTNGVHNIANLLPLALGAVPLVGLHIVANPHDLDITGVLAGDLQGLLPRDLFLFQISDLIPKREKERERERARQFDRSGKKKKKEKKETWEWRTA